MLFWPKMRELTSLPQAYTSWILGAASRHGRKGAREGKETEEMKGRRLGWRSAPRATTPLTRSGEQA